MRISTLLAAIVAALALNACVGIIVPIPVNSPGDSSQTRDQNEKR